MDTMSMQLRRAGVSEPEPLQRGSGARLQMKAGLRGLPLDEQMALVRPPTPKAERAGVVQRSVGAVGAAVQMEETTDNRPAIAKLDRATLHKVVLALKKAGVWASLVANVRATTAEGTKPLESSVEDDVLLEALVFVETAFQFGAGVSLDDMLFDELTRARIVEAIKAEANPPIPPAGTFGMVTADTELTLPDGSKQMLKAGDAVESLGEVDGELRVLVHSGKEIEGTLGAGAFRAQPRISTDDKTGKTDAYTYQQYAGELFLGEPSIDDVDQGSLGDCFLIAAMGAVAAANPELIRKAVVYNGDETYTVTFQELQKDGKTFKPHPETVDAYLPTRQGGGAKRTAYAQSDQAFNPENQALWPAIVEKAYAQWKGGYSAIQKGGQSAKAMEAITGVKSVRAAMPAEDDVIATFRTWQEEGKAVVCGTRDWIQQSSQKGLLAGTGDGPFTGTLKDKQNNPAEVVSGTVTIVDAEGKARVARDDGKGGFSGVGVDDGEIDYENGRMSLSYKQNKGPAAAADLEATYRFEGTLDVGLNVHGNHAYMFSAVEGDKLLFRNPWGPAAQKHPQPLTAGDFIRLFETLAVNATLPQQES